MNTEQEKKPVSEERKLYLKNWQANNRDKVRASCRKSYQKHRAERIEKCKAYNREHKDIINARAIAWNAEHREVVNERARQKYRLKKISKVKKIKTTRKVKEVTKDTSGEKE